MSNEAKAAVQAGLDRRKQERISNIQDMEAIGAVAGKRDRERKSQEEEARRIHEEFKAHRLLLAQQEEEELRQEEAYEEELAQRWQDFKGAMPVAVGLCAMGAIYFLGVHNPDVALVAGGLLMAAGVSYGGLAFIRWRGF